MVVTTGAAARLSHRVAWQRKPFSRPHIGLMALLSRWRAGGKPLCPIQTLQVCHHTQNCHDNDFDMWMIDTVVIGQFVPIFQPDLRNHRSSQ
jgi:hypothetical protein